MIRSARPTTDQATIAAFIRAINAHDFRALAELMTENHAFVDAAGVRQSGRALMESRWVEFCRLFPSYKIESVEILAAEAHWAVFGWVSFDGGGDLKKTRTPAAWRVTVEAGQIAEWQVFCDLEPMLRAHRFDRWRDGSQ